MSDGYENRFFVAEKKRRDTEIARLRRENERAKSVARGVARGAPGRREDMTVKDIVTEWLRANGYDGLAGEECGCSLDNLMPCDETCQDACVPGHEQEATQEDVDTWFDGKVGDRIIKEGS